jgi:hypothetical protein
MFGVNQKILDLIEQIIGTQFDSFLVDFLGIVPKIDKNKRFKLHSKKDSLTSLFIRSLGNKIPNKEEEQVLKTQLRVAAGYVEALKVRTQTRTAQAVNAYAQEQSLKKEKVRPSDIRKIIVKEMDGSQNHVKLIVNAESNQCRGTATALQIVRVASDNDDKDPNVFFNVVIDERNDPETYRLHLLPDRLTPRLWKISDLGAEYHKKGDPTPKLQGTNPNCRCHLTFLPKGFAFNESGKIAWKSSDHDEYKFQKDNYPPVSQLEEIKKKKVDKIKKSVVL